MERCRFCALSMMKTVWRFCRCWRDDNLWFEIWIAWRRTGAAMFSFGIGWVMFWPGIGSERFWLRIGWNLFCRTISMPMAACFGSLCAVRWIWLCGLERFACCCVRWSIPRIHGPT